MWSMGRRSLVTFGMCLLIGGCTTQRFRELPPPASCREKCAVNVCLLGEAYEQLATDDERAKAEIRCDVLNANAAQYCAELHNRCGEVLEDRAKR
jgi:hypothetical protein